MDGRCETHLAFIPWLGLFGEGVFTRAAIAVGWIGCYFLIRRETSTLSGERSAETLRCEELEVTEGPFSLESCFTTSGVVGDKEPLIAASDQAPRVKLISPLKPRRLLKIIKFI